MVGLLSVIQFIRTIHLGADELVGNVFSVRDETRWNPGAVDHTYVSATAQAYTLQFS